MPYGAFTAGRGYRFSDDILAIAGQLQSYKSLVGNDTNFVPAAVHVNTSNDQAEEALGYAYINGWLVGENVNFSRVYKVHTGIPIGLAFAEIYSTGTTARGITVLDAR